MSSYNVNIDKPHSSSEDPFYVALNFLKNKKFHEAENFLQEYLKKNNEIDRPTLSLYALILYLNKKEPELLQLFNQKKNKIPQEYNIYLLQKGHVFLTLDVQISSKPLDFYHLGIFWQKLSHTKEALRAYKRAEEDPELEPFVLYNRAILMEKNNEPQDIEELERIYNKLFPLMDKRFPFFIQSHFHFWLSQQERGYINTNVIEHEEFIFELPLETVIGLLSYGYFFHRHYQNALELLEQTKERELLHPEFFLFEKALFYELLQQYDKASLHYEELASKKISASSLIYYQAYIRFLLHQGAFQKAQEQFEKIPLIVQENLDEFLYLKALLSLCLQKYSEAEKIILQSYRKENTHSKNFYLLAVCHQGQGYHESALALLEELYQEPDKNRLGSTVHLEPEIALLALRLGLIHKAEQYIKLLPANAKNFPRNFLAYFLLLYLKGQKEQAKSFLKQEAKALKEDIYQELSETLLHEERSFWEKPFYKMFLPIDGNSLLFLFRAWPRFEQTFLWPLGKEYYPLLSEFSQDHQTLKKVLFTEYIKTCSNEQEPPESLFDIARNFLLVGYRHPLFTQRDLIHQNPYLCKLLELEPSGEELQDIELQN